MNCRKGFIGPWRHTGVDSRGAFVWVVSLEKDPVIALQGFVEGWSVFMQLP
jgi:DNA-binding transcriptional regulator of glucitol operon